MHSNSVGNCEIVTFTGKEVDFRAPINSSSGYAWLPNLSFSEDAISIYDVDFNFPLR